MSWLAAAWFVARKDVEYLLRSRETILWTFVMPIAFFYMIGTITGGFGGGGEERDKLAVATAGEPGFLYDQLVHHLEGQEYEVVPVAGDEELAAHRRRLTVPADLTARVVAGEAVELRFVRRGGGLGADYDDIRVQRAVYTLLADVIAAAQQGPLTGDAIARLNALPRNLTLRVEPAGERREIPTGFEQAVPGTMVMFTLLVLLTSGAVFLVIERRQGLLRRLASTPLPRGAVVAGKWAGKLVLGLVQIGFAMAAGTLLFDVSWGAALPMVAVVLAVYAGLVAALGLLLGCLARSEGQAVGLGVLSANLLAALGGCWWPIEITPAWMQSFSRLLPTGMTMDALHRLVSFGQPAAEALPHLATLATLALVAVWLAVRQFRWE